MRFRHFVFLLILTATPHPVDGQKPFSEGIIVYNVRLESPDHSFVSGLFTLYIKGDLVRKDLRLSNGYQDKVIYYCTRGRGVSLQNRNGKKYAIELDLAAIRAQQEEYRGYQVRTMPDLSKQFAGYPARAATVRYPDGDSSIIYYTTEWRPVQPITFERYPSVNFLPLFYDYVDEHGMTMWFEASSVAPGPVENSVFRVPADFKIISWAEYKEMSR